MHSERLIGLLALIGTFTLAMYIFYPANKQVDINSMSLSHELSESKNGEISRWKL